MSLPDFTSLGFIGIPAVAVVNFLPIVISCPGSYPRGASSGASGG